MHGPFKRSSVIMLLAVFVCTGVFGLALLSGPKPAHAQLPVTDAANLAPNTATSLGVGISAQEDVKAGAFELIIKAFINSAALAVLNAGHYFAQKLAFDAANYIASGGKGQKPFFTTDGLGDHVKNTALDAAGEALGTLSQFEGFQKLGINLCNPTSPRVALNIKLGFLNGLPGQLGGPISPGQPRPTCSWNQIEQNWDQFTNLDSDEVLSQAGAMFTPGQSSLGAAVEFNRYSFNLINKKQEEAIDKFIANSGFKDKLSKVSGKVLTPAQTIQNEMNRVNANAAEKGEDLVIGFTPAAFGKGAFGILPAALQTFVNTLGEKLMKRVFERGLIALSDVPDTSTDLFNFDANPSGGGRQAAELANADLLTPKIFTSTDLDELTQFATCPAEFRGINNCVMDQQLFNGVNRSTHGSAITVRQAIDQGFLRDEWRLLPQAHPKNGSRNCYREAYCHSNLVKMRRARIIPAGWELAANSPFNDSADPVTFGEVMDRFNDCPVNDDGTVDESKLPDPLHPWCRLIDPNWVLKYPEAICRQEAPGPLLLNSAGSVRGRICVDSTSCIQEDSDGNCIGGFGYCVQESAFWKMDADSCPSYSASCQTVRRADGREFSYLMNTTRAEVCNSENAGCREYSRVQNAVSNSGFEDELNGQARSWSGASGLDRTGSNSLRGRNALIVNGGASASQDIHSVLGNEEYTLSASALAANGASGSTTVTVRFFDRAGSPIAPPGGFTTSCDTTASGDGVAFDVLLSDLGYTTAGCDITSPEGAVSAEMIIAPNVDAYFDEVGMVGSSFSSEPLDSIFLNAKTDECPAGQVGCTELVRASSATLNLVRNPSFEEASSDGDTARFWDMDPANYEANLFVASDGGSSVALTPSAVEQEVKELAPGATYAFSMFTRFEGSGSPPSASATLRLFDSDGDPIPATPEESSPISATTCGRSGNTLTLDLAVGSEYERSNCQFTTPSDIGSVRIELAAGSTSGTLHADAVQLELSVNPTGFHEGYSGGAQRLHLKLPPKGLNCTGSPADPDACGQFAPSCRRSDVGCNLYTPVGEGNSVPAVTSSGDECPSACAGYDTFREEPTDFFDEEFPVFFIPSTGQSCTAAEAGCEEFTNLETLAEGGEGLEYFTSLRLCTEPNENTATFYTWEGSEEEGFQLRTWRLHESNVTSPATGAAGSDPTGGVGPCTNLEYNAQGQPSCADDLAADNLETCTRTETLFNPDCREFYDTEGNIHYRSFSKTILATQDCAEYRITRSDEDNCRAHGGLWTGTECHYFAVAESSQSCRAAANGCRAYTGNASRNVRVVINDTFEDGTTQQWFASPGGGSTSDVVNSNESVTAGGHSLRSTSAVVTKDVSETIRRGRSYLLTFWAKGNGDLDVAFSDSGDAPFTFDQVNETDVPVSLTTEWQVYTVGPVDVVQSPERDFSDPANNEQLVFSFSGTGSPQFFLDNIELREVAESVYVIKDSWNTPAACDQTPEGVLAPQFHLGCRAYTDKDGQTAHLKSFSRLCSEEAVGCEAFYHTQNSESPFGQTFNAVCDLGTACVPSGGSVTCDCQVGGESVCQVTAGSASCKYDVDEEVEPLLTTDGGHISPEGDTAVVPDDDIIYVINRQEFRCDPANASCSQLGLRTFNQDRDVITEWETVNLMMDPDRYADTLCKEQENFCQAYTRKIDGAPLYFKDPTNHTCEYRENVNIDGFNYNGWFKKDLNEPCYDDFLEAGNLFGIWKNSDPLYDGWVGTCSPNFDQCKEFIDPVDTSSTYPAGRPYYAIKNDRLDTTTCQNQVSLTTSPRAAQDASACALFRQSDDLNLRYDASASYDRSDEANGELVDAVSVPGSNDANIVIRVRRDRRCSQWLDCRTSETVFNNSTGEFQNVCTSFGVCDRFEKVGDTTQCVNFVDPEDRPTAGQVLDLGTYQSRQVGRDGVEFSGYAVPNRYPVNELVTMNIAAEGDPDDMRLVRVGGACSGGASYGDACGNENNRGNQGTCLGFGDPLACVYPIDGSRGLSASDNLNLDRWENRYPSTSCRAYPQEDAPFPSEVADPNGWDDSARPINAGNPVLTGPGQGFEGANICQRRIDPDTGKEYESCECNYQIAEYGGRTEKRYFSIEDSDLPRGYCQGGSFDGYECDPRAIGLRADDNLSCCTRVIGEDDIFGGGGCASGASCKELSKIDRVVGYEGQCLERDLATPVNGSFDDFACATWRPVGIVGGTLDIYNLNRTAGYFAPPDRRFYCAGGLASGTLVSKTNEAREGSVQKFIDRFDLDPDSNVVDNYREELIRHHLPGGEDKDIGYSIDIGIERHPDDHWVKGLYDTTGSNNAGPATQPMNQFFGPAEPTKFKPGFKSAGGNCQKGQEGEFCIFPGESGIKGDDEAAADGDTEDDTDPAEPGALLGQGNTARGVLGCYEVADSGSASTTYIEHPYIGPPIYADQLVSIEIGITDDLYKRDGNADGIEGTGRDERAKIATNPHQDIFADCNDEGNDNIDPESGTHLDIFHMTEANEWSIDGSDSEGTILLIAKFDSLNRLKALRIGASDNNDEGAFGLEHLSFNFKPGCSAVAQVDVPGEFGLTRAVTDHVNPYNNYSGSGPVEASEIGTACRPWGAVGNISNDPPKSPWTFVTARDEENNQCVGDAFLAASAYEDVSNTPADTLRSLRNLFRSATRVWDFMELTDDSGNVRTQDTLYRENQTKPYDDRASMFPQDVTPVPTAGHQDAILNTFDPLGLEGYYHFPKVASVSAENCDADGTCAADTPGTITVNGRSEGVVSAQNGILNSIARFYGWASHNAMPILERTLIWGDFVPKEPAGKGWYKNQKPFCSAGTGIGICEGGNTPGVSCVGDGECPGSGGECVHRDAVGECNGLANAGLTCISDDDCPGSTTCDTDEPNHFGNTPAACSARPFQFEHVYTCSLDELEALSECTGPDDAAENAPCYRLIDTDGDPSTDPSPACVYRPAVQLKDNWGWCNCTGDDCPIDGGIHETHENDDGEIIGCDIEKAEPEALPYTLFQGEVRVFAKPNDAAAFSPGGGIINFPFFFGGGGGFLAP